jgi:hypothetical protein
LPKEFFLNRVWNWFSKFDMFVRLYIATMLLIILAIPIMVTQQTNRSSHAAGNSYYVAKNGSDSNPGTETSPWLTIQKAVNTVSAGDTVYVKEGNYNEKVSFVGSPANLTFKAYSGTKPVISGIGLTGSGDGIIYIRNTDYLTIDGFEIAHTTASTGGYGVYAYRDIDHLTLKNLTIHDINRGGVRIDGTYDNAGAQRPAMNGSVTNLLIDGIQVYDTNRVIPSDEITSLIRVNGAEIKNSVFHDPGLNPLDRSGAVALGKNGVDLKNGCANISIHDNEIYGSGYTYGGSSMGTMWEGIYIDNNAQNQGNIKIYNNYIHDTWGGIELGSEEAGHTTLTNVDIYNNIFYNNQYALRVYPNDFDRTYKFINNTAYKNYNTIYEHPFGNGKNINCVIRNNILYGTSGADPLINIGNFAVSGKPTIDHNIYYNSAGYGSLLTTLTGGYTPANPLFVDINANNFKLQSVSPVINAGSSDNAPSTDYDDTPRPQGAGHDIGAFEYKGTANPTVANFPTPTVTQTSAPTKTPTAIPTKTLTPVPTKVPTIAPTKASTTIVPTTSTTTLQNGLLGWWKFDGNTLDSSSYGNNASVGGAVLTVDRQNQTNKAYKFDGSNDYIQIATANKLDMGTGDRTIAGWFKFGRSSFSTYETLYFSGAGSGGTNQDGIFIYVYNSSSINVAFSDGTATRLIKQFNANKSLYDGAWHHLAFVFDRDANLNLYVDGVVSSTGGFNISSQKGDVNDIYEKYIGRVISGGYPFSGNMDDLRIYSRALSASEISTLYKTY